MNIDAYLTIPPNWGQDISISHIWRTGIQESITGIEKRSALYTWRRRKIEYSLDLLDSKEAQWVKRYLYQYMHQIWGIPIWPDFTDLTSQANSGQKILSVAQTSYRRFEEGGRVILVSLSDFTLCEEGEIDTLTDTQITLADNLAVTWPSGSAAS